MLADDPRRPDVTARHGLALLAGAQHAEGASIIKEAADVLVAAGDVRGAASLLADSAWTAELAGFTDDAFALASIGVALVADGPEDDVWARLYVLDLRRREADDPRGLGIPIVTPQRRRAAALMHADPRHRDELAWAVWDHRDEILERGTDDVWALTMWAGRYGDALAMWQRRATAAEARGQLADAVSAWAGAASCAGALGRLADAANWTDRARELARRVELRGAFALHLVGARDVLVHARGSGFDDLMEWVAELTIYRTDRAQRWAEAIQYAAMARLLAIDTRYDDARTMIDGVVEVLPDAPTTVVSTNRMVGDVVAAAWLSGDTRHVGVLTESVRTGLLEPDFRCPMTEPRHAQGRVVGLTGDVEGARQWFDEARVVARADGLGPLIAIIDHDEALLLLRAGRAEDAAPLLDAARRRATRLGMIGWVRRTERLALGSGH
jgi:tetratricopeptide (TPR) repeat protein